MCRLGPTAREMARGAIDKSRMTILGHKRGNGPPDRWIFLWRESAVTKGQSRTRRILQFLRNCRQKPDQSGEAQNLHKPGVHPSRSASQDGCNLTGRLMPMATWSIPTGPTVRPHKNPSCASIGLTRQKSRASAALGNPCCWKNSSVTTLQSVPAGLDIGRSLRRRCHPSLLFAAFMASCQDAWRQCPPHRPVLRIGTYGDQSAWTR
jgi:hypothetical protein